MENSAKPDSQKILTLLQRFASQHAIETWCLAYSGGLDSQVLLHLLASHSRSLRAVYVDHGLQAESAQWAEHCRRSCQQLNIPFQTLSVDARAGNGQSPEAAAREARYTALASLIHPNEGLLTAQHQSDQAETLLLQLLRGAGAAGLAAMPYANPFASGWLVRPLLDWCRPEIEAYARWHGLRWVEDPSNQSSQYDRNFLRNQIIPLLQQRWPSMQQTLSRAAQLQAEQADLLADLADADLSRVCNEQGQPLLKKMATLSRSRQANVLRRWIKLNGYTLPSQAVLEQGLTQMLSHRQDADPRVSWGAVDMRRYRGVLYLVSNQREAVQGVLKWNPQKPIGLPGMGQILSMRTVDQGGLQSGIMNSELQVRFRQGGEKIRPLGRSARHSLKNLFQEAAVPPWMRDQIPLVFKDNDLVAVTGYWIADEYASRTAESGVLPVLKGESEEDD